jgi:hypothetical protein
MPSGLASAPNTFLNQFMRMSLKFGVCTTSDRTFDTHYMRILEYTGELQV